MFNFGAKKKEEAAGGSNTACQSWQEFGFMEAMCGCANGNCADRPDFKCCPKMKRRTADAPAHNEKAGETDA